MHGGRLLILIVTGRNQFPMTSKRKLHDYAKLRGGCRVEARFEVSRKVGDGGLAAWRTLSGPEIVI